jgi:hypothetical protein
MLGISIEGHLARWDIELAVGITGQVDGNHIMALRF